MYTITLVVICCIYMAVGENDNTTCFYVVNQNDASLLDKICIPLNNTFAYQEIRAEEIPINTSAELFFDFVANGLDLNYIWVLICGSMVFFMQAGFTVLEAGSVKASSLQNILFKNLMDACVGALLWWLFGYAVAYGEGETGNQFLSTGNVALSGTEEYNFFFFQWAFAATAATIVSGSVAERCTHIAYFTYTSLLTAWVYPIVVHWIWSSTGFLSAFNDEAIIEGGVIDFAGSGVVHMVGGFSGLMGAIFLGPRLGRFDDNNGNTKYERRLQKQLKFGNSVPLQVIGAIILWFGWFGFNPGSTLVAVNSMTLASKVAVTTTLAAGSGGVFTAFAGFYLEGHFMVPRVVNGVLAGLVSITAPCSVVGPGSAVAIGFIGGVIYYTASKFLDRIQVDDPLDAFPVHGVCGAWGLLSVALFATSDNIAFAGYNDILVEATMGKIFSHQLLACVLIIVWTCTFTSIVFFILKFIKKRNGNNLLRIPKDVERIGLDRYKHGGDSLINFRYHRTSTNASDKPKTSNIDDDDDGDDGDDKTTNEDDAEL